MTSICLLSVGVSGLDRLSTFIEVILRPEKGAGLLFPTELRIGEGDRIGDGDDIRLICLSGFILSSTIASGYNLRGMILLLHLFFSIFLLLLDFSD